ncbi:hypothetical protein DPMN_097080 [Dreissena polymorpha]|uniref:Uncharacterized protein n=1 Tax=Dreissena polymorpha TaxID=45954 RepID=A0A9D4R5D6_DREPO|nr:hypothetical protein DPMN_097080 [Dreissena polymorpha]
MQEKANQSLAHSDSRYLTIENNRHIVGEIAGTLVLLAQQNIAIKGTQGGA